MILLIHTDSKQYIFDVKVEEYKFYLEQIEDLDWVTIDGVTLRVDDIQCIYTKEGAQKCDMLARKLFIETKHEECDQKCSCEWNLDEKERDEWINKKVKEFLRDFSHKK